MALLIRALAASMLLIALPCAAQPCRVLDPELAHSYQGSCVEGLAEGRGIAQGTARYEGAFRAGKKHGDGIKTWPNGDRYEGQFSDDQKHGEGRYTWGPQSQQPGASYQGHFQHDRRHGWGRYITAEGLALESQWSQDAPLGPFPPQWVAYIRHQAALSAALEPGVKACKRLKIGHNVEDRIEGIVERNIAQGLAVRVTHPGKYPNEWQGTLIKPGSLIEGPITGWIPCQ